MSKRKKGARWKKRKRERRESLEQRQAEREPATLGGLIGKIASHPAPTRLRLVVDDEEAPD